MPSERDKAKRWQQFILQMLSGFSTLVAFVALSPGWWIVFIVAALLAGTFALMAVHAGANTSSD